MIARGRCRRTGLGRIVTNVVCASVLAIVIAGNAGCSPSARENPSAQFARFQNSVANSDPKSLVGMLSHATLRELRANGGADGLADEYARVLIAARAASAHHRRQN